MAEQSHPLSENDLKEVAAEGNIGKVIELLRRNNEEWKGISLNIGITGVTGAGKSSFINTIRGLTADDEGAAAVEVYDTTSEITSYTHPDHPSLVFWDLPGVGSVKYPLEKYLKDINFEQFDIFLILSACRFRREDLLLANKIRSLEKKFLFVRTKMEEDVQNNKKSHPRSHSESTVVKTIEEDIRKHLKNENFPEEMVFLIDNYSTDKFDFKSLVDTIIKQMPENKREAMVLKMSLITQGVFEKKVQALSNRIVKVSLLSALTGVMPIPGTGAVIDSALLVTELNLYKSQLGLDSSQLENNARRMNTNITELVERLGLKSVAVGAAKCLQQALSFAVASEAFEKTLPIAFPIIGCLLSAGLSYGVTFASLKYLLKCCSDDAQKLNNELFQTV